MKKILLICFVLIFHNIFGQISNQKIKTQKEFFSIYINDTLKKNQKKAYYVKYNKDGDTIRIKKYWTDLSRKRNVLKEEIKYNNKHQILKQTKYTEYCRLYEKSKHTYDNKDSLISFFYKEISFQGNHIFWSKVGRQYFERDSIGRKIKTKKYHRDGRILLLSCTIDKGFETYKYDENGNLIQEINIDSKKDTFYIHSYFYDHQSKILEENFSGGSYPYKTTYLYDEKGNMTKKLIKYKNKSDTIVAIENNYHYENDFYFIRQTCNNCNDTINLKYDYNNNLIEKCVCPNSKKYSIQCDQYDKTGIILKSVATFNDTIIWERDCSYNDKGLLIKTLAQRYEDSTLLFIETNYIYDYNNKLIKSKTLRNSEQDSIEYFYDSNGNMILEYHISNNYNEYLIGISMLFFDYNIDGTINKKTTEQYNIKQSECGERLKIISNYYYKYY